VRRSSHITQIHIEQLKQSRLFRYIVQFQAEQRGCVVQRITVYELFEEVYLFSVSGSAVKSITGRSTVETTSSLMK
jgi:hypothetical protein